jgi:RNA polymerase sigma-70 factor, ECF subfamily
MSGVARRIDPVVRTALNQSMRARTTQESLLRCAQRQDREAWSTIYDQFYPRVYAFLMTRLRDSNLAEDLASDVFVNALKAISTYEERGLELTAWLFRIAHNRLIDHYRRCSIRQSTSLDDFEQGEATASSHSTKPECLDPDKIDIEIALRALGDDQRQVIHLRFVEGLTSGEVAAVLGKSLASVKILQHRALKALKKALGSKEAEL